MTVRQLQEIAFRIRVSRPEDNDRLLWLIVDRMYPMTRSRLQ